MFKDRDEALKEMNQALLEDDREEAAWEETDDLWEEDDWEEEEDLPEEEPLETTITKEDLWPYNQKKEEQGISSYTLTSLGLTASVVALILYLVLHYLV